MAKCGDTVCYPCGQCGTEFTIVVGRHARRRYCSGACKQKSHREGKSLRYPEGYTPPSRVPKKNLPPTPCLYCDQPTRRPKYCSQACAGMARSRRLGVRPIGVVRAEAKTAKLKHVCLECGTHFQKGGGNNAGLYCSVRCYSKRPGLSIAADRDMYRRWAGRTRKVFLAQRVRLRHARSALVTALVRYVVNPKRPCADCGAGLGHTHSRNTVCSSCRLRRERNSPAKRADKAYRKALQRGKIDGAERFDPLEILARDGWRCHICGISTPKRLRGAYDDRSPELDHILPLAIGGLHTRLNTACACRRCNIAKGSRQLGQLRLVA